LQITTPQGCVFTDTLNVQTVDCSNPLPNIITPNGDGVNDFFYLDDATSQLKNEIFIVNRWGEQVFYAAPYQNNFSGEELSEGVYFYIYYPMGSSEHSDIFKHGFIHLVK
jgi:gliding motility-associated-like protein